MKFRREDFALKYFTDIQETKFKKKKNYTGCFGGCFFSEGIETILLAFIVEIEQN